MVALFEPRVSGRLANHIISRFGFANSYRMEAHGFSGGLWLLWNDEVEVEILQIFNQFISSRCCKDDSSLWVYFTDVYASPHGAKQKHLWNQLLQLDPRDDVPWIVGRDFNVILSHEERLEGSKSSVRGSRLFAKFLFTSGLNDLGYQGPPFTWARRNVQECLDRCLVNAQWLSTFPMARVLYLDFLGSDHRPMCVQFSNPVTDITQQPFRFIAAWQDHPDFQNFLQPQWVESRGLVQNLKNFRSEVQHWNKETFGQIGHRKKRLLARLRGIDRALQ
ncbi:hypothetical protein HRI_004559800 [Hibiscus trionum]|uniref:Endonuclease/exonuclease/phosphatase domain-containing protein n=1 Tax=Hibiscus trionum TaxID=183268 RepID=A0A9W7MTP6_HIBTR|nr:hypothetical protein HRI_004559800 [Hibiscus trionum]